MTIRALLVLGLCITSHCEGFSVSQQQSRPRRSSSSLHARRTSTSRPSSWRIGSSTSTSMTSTATATPTLGVSNSTGMDTFLIQDLRRQYNDLMQLESTAEPQAPPPAAIARARWLLLIAAAVYGTNFSCVKLLGEAHIPVGVSSMLRFGMAALATSPWLMPANKKMDSSAAMAATLAGFEVGMWNSVGYVAQAVGLETTAASKSAFLCSLAVVVVPLLDFVTGKRLLPKQAAGTIMALLGVALLELGGVTDWTLTTGDIASLVQPIAFGIGFWRMERAMHKYPNQANRSTAAQLLAVFLGSAVYALVTDPGSLALDQIGGWLGDPTILLGLFWTGVIATALTVYMETMALETLSAAETTLIFSTEPLWGTAWAALLMGEQLGLDSAAGALLIIAGCVFSNLGWDGIRKQLSFRGSTTNSTPQQSTQPLAPWLTQLALVRGGVASVIDSSATNAWNSLNVGTKVMALQAQDVLEDMLPWLMDR